MPVIHQPRVAWDGARAIVAAAGAGEPEYAAFADQVGLLLGPSYRNALLDTRYRLATETRPDTPLVEAGIWRTRLEDLLRGRPDVAEDLRILTSAVAAAR